MVPERLQVENRWVDGSKEQLINRWPLDGKAPSGIDGEVKLFGAIIGKTPRQVVATWHNLHRKANKTMPIVHKDNQKNGGRRWTPEDDAYLLETIPLDTWLGQDHWKVGMLADHLGRTRQAIYDRHRVLQYPSTSRHYSDNGHGRLKELAEELLEEINNL